MEPLRWEAFEYEHKKKGADWFWALGIIALAGAATVAILGNLLLAVLILIGALTLALTAAKTPSPVMFEINKSGIVVDGTLHPYTTLKSFWLEEFGGKQPPKLLFVSKRVLIPQIEIPLPDVDLPDLREQLLLHLEEEELQEGIARRLVSWVGF